MWSEFLNHNTPSVLEPQTEEDYDIHKRQRSQKPRSQTYNWKKQGRLLTEILKYLWGKSTEHEHYKNPYNILRFGEHDNCCNFYPIKLGPQKITSQKPRLVYQLGPPCLWPLHLTTFLTASINRLEDIDEKILIFSCFMYCYGFFPWCLCGSGMSYIHM